MAVRRRARSSSRPAPDGLGGGSIGSHQETDFATRDSPNRAGQYVIVLSGACRLDSGTQAFRLSCVFVLPGDGPVSGLLGRTALSAPASVSRARDCMNAAASAFTTVLQQVGLTPDQFGSVNFVGVDPIVASPHRIRAAIAAALAAHAAGIVAIWRLRAGRDQAVRVDVRRAVVPGLLPLNYLSQNGYLLGWQARKRVPNFFPTKDGRRFYVLHAIDYPQLLLRTLDFLDCSNSEEALARVIARWNADDLEEALAEQKLVGGIARSKDEWAAHPQGRWLATQPVVAIEKIGESAPEPFEPAPRPLTGIRVLDMGHVLAGPTAARTLAEQGADVLRISSPGNPDPNIQLMDTGFGKRSAFIDLIGLMTSIDLEILHVKRTSSRSRGVRVPSTVVGSPPTSWRRFDQA